MASYTNRVRQAHSPQEALLIIAEALDNVEVLVKTTQDIKLDPWTGDWSLAPSIQDKEDRARGPVEIQQDEDTTTISIALPSKEKQMCRVQFETQALRLDETLGTDENWTDAYAKGGPLWLYHANRDLFMSYPFSVRQQMVMDVEEDDPQEAHLMAIDVLKHPGETGPGGTGMKMAEGNIG